MKYIDFCQIFQILKNKFILFLGIRVLQHTKIGLGCRIDVPEMHQAADFIGVIVAGKDNTINLDMEGLDVTNFNPPNAVSKKFKIPGETYNIAKNPMDRLPSHLSSIVTEDDSNITFACDRPFCVAEFPTNQQLREHTASNKCYVACRNQPIGDYLRIRYFLHWGSMNANKGKYDKYI